MSSSSTTTNYKFPQWTATDYPSFIKDLNPAFVKIDTEIKSNKSAAQEAQSAATSAAASASAAATSAEAAQEAADSSVAILAALGITDQSKATAFKAKVENAVQKGNILASDFEHTEG